MIRDIIALLSIDDYYGVSDTVDVAKGLYKTPTNLKEVKQHIKRKNGYR